MFMWFPFLRRAVCFGEGVVKYITKVLHHRRNALASVLSVCMIVVLAAGNADGRGTLTAFAKTSSRETKNQQAPASQRIVQGIAQERESLMPVKGVGAIMEAEKMIMVRHGQLVVGYLLTQEVMRQEQANEAAARLDEIKGRIAEKDQVREKPQEGEPARTQPRNQVQEKYKLRVPCSREDYQTLLRIVEAEAGICDSKGKILVANVVINRVQSGEFPDTIRDVVYQPSQFSPVSNGTINTCKVTAQTVECVERALSGEDYSQGALYFMNRDASRSGAVQWFDGRLTYLFSYGGHEFFK